METMDKCTNNKNTHTSGFLFCFSVHKTCVRYVQFFSLKTGVIEMSQNEFEYIYFHLKLLFCRTASRIIEISGSLKVVITEL